MKKVKPLELFIYTVQSRGISFSSHFGEQLFLILEAALCDGLELFYGDLVETTDDLSLSWLPAGFPVGLAKYILGFNSWDVTTVTYK